jgi:uncharacterized damage-inducible protein DinB
MTRRVSLVSAGLLCALPALASAQAPPDANPMTAAAKGQFTMVKNYITKTADKVGEDLYGFKPTPEVRSLGQLLGHIANANFMICSRAAGEKSPSTEDIEKTKTTKADLSKALADSFAYCDGVFAKMDDKAGAEVVDFFRQKQPKLAVLQFNTAHDFEHYGNLVTYMRLKGIVPPSSEGGM